MMHLIFVIHGITLVLQATSAAQLTNLAFEKPTKHKTEFNPPTWASDKAVDADPGGTTCTATGKDKPDPWWYVDLERYVYISNITLKNRISPYTSITSKLHDFDIYIGGCEIDTSDLSTWAFCTHYTGSASSGEVLNFSCDLDDVFGRYVLVNIPGATEMLTLCNVEVIGVYGCPPGWMQRYFACYKIESSPKTFALAQDSCSKRGAVLVVIDDETEFNFISTSVSSASVVNPWIGMHRSDSLACGCLLNCEWCWVNGQRTAWSSWFLAKSAATSFECGHFSTTDQWDAADCTEERPFICEAVTCGAQSTVLPRTETTTIQETTTQEESITHDGTTKQDETPSQDETTTTQDDITSQDETTTTQDGISVHSDLTETTVTIEATTFDDGLTETKATTVASAQSETTTSTTTHSTTTSNPGTTPSDDTSTTSSANPLSAIFSATTTAMLGSEWELAWNVWTPWTSCPSCGDGQQMRLKLCSDDSNSTYCDILLPYTPLKLEIKYGIQWRDCVIPECPTNGFWSSWSDWSECSDTCGGGYEKRARLCLGVSNDGAPCEGDEKENRPCNYHECEDEVAQGTSNINKLREFYLPYEPYKESDSITSNKSIGLMATGLIIAVFAIIFVLDAVTFQKQLKLLCRNIKGARRRRKLKIQVEPRREER